MERKPRRIVLKDLQPRADPKGGIVPVNLAVDPYENASAIQKPEAPPKQNDLKPL
jgi:hypothetical protein